MLARSILQQILAASSAATLLMTSPAWACDVRTTPLATTPIVYDPFAMAPVRGSAQLDVELVDGEACNVELDLLDGNLHPLQNLSVGGPEPAIFAIRNADSADPVHVVVQLSPNQRRRTVRWDFTPARDAVLAPGYYQAAIAVGVRAQPSVASANYVSGLLNVTVPARAQVNIAGSSGGFGSSHVSVIDFGKLRSGAQRRVFLQIRANSGVVAQISSRNHGVLRNQTWPDATPIAYSLALNGASIDLAAPAAVPLAPPPTIDGLSLPLDLMIGSVEGKMAGQYSDIITVDVSPR